MILSYTCAVIRYWLGMLLVLLIGIQGSTLDYAAPNGGTSAASLPCPPDAVMMLSHHGDCCSHHSLPASCLAHCAGMAALPPSSPPIPPSTARISLDPLLVVSFPSERPSPAFRPPIA